MGHLIIKKDEIALSILDLKMRLQSLWNIEIMKVIPHGKGFYHVLLHTLVDQNFVMVQEIAYTKPSVFSRSQDGTLASILIITSKLLCQCGLGSMAFL